jgi:pimeloyl-ACP methyl ester carboxylesterase
MDRSVFAPDLPGCGESDPVGDEPVTSHALAVAMTDFLQSMRLRRVDLLAHGDGVAVASALLALNPDAIGRIVVSAGDPDGIPGRPVRRIDLDDSGAVTEPQLGDLKGFLGIN